jgi:hypothetical protein
MFPHVTGIRTSYFMAEWSWTLLVRRLDSSPAFHGTRRQSSPLVPLLSQTNAVHTTPRCILILLTRLCLGLPSGAFPPITCTRSSSSDSRSKRQKPCIVFADCVAMVDESAASKGLDCTCYTEIIRSASVHEACMLLWLMVAIMTEE